MTSPSRGDRRDRGDRGRLEQERGVGAVEAGVDRVERLGRRLRVADGAGRDRRRRRCRPAARARPRAASTSSPRTASPPAGRNGSNASRRAVRIAPAGRASRGRTGPRRRGQPARAPNAARSSSAVDVGVDLEQLVQAVAAGARRRRRRARARSGGSAGRSAARRSPRGTASAGSRTPGPPRTSGSSAARRGSAGPSRSGGGRRRSSPARAGGDAMQRRDASAAASPSAGHGPQPVPDAVVVDDVDVGGAGGQRSRGPAPAAPLGSSYSPTTGLVLTPVARSSL